MQKIPQKTAFTLSLITGLTLIFIGIRFFVMPLVAETAFGIHTHTGGDYSFQYIKGIRDLFCGVILLLLLFTRQYKALGLILLVSIMIPAADFGVVISHPDFEAAKLFPHVIAVLLGLGLGSYYLINTSKKKDHVAL
ncbi:hypothetical protein A8C56_01945 [Niabella ginsenosidivorans]|uniref:DUF4267 domain-containing protein n=1 Tax=Niabella ginsenosidivorans TaxID=1176587 RepID=A0A1A9HYK2_9BACT|nr:DUF4267 domain-containing protein [Niabella ginsenosidivorans]ANH79899.1 hypothetical protein A8C56_01945 [Niabella ginsenosidivorans]